MLWNLISALILKTSHRDNAVLGLRQFWFTKHRQFTVFRHFPLNNLKKNPRTKKEIKKKLMRKKTKWQKVTPKLVELSRSWTLSIAVSVLQSRRLWVFISSPWTRSSASSEFWSAYQQYYPKARGLSVSVSWNTRIAGGRGDVREENVRWSSHRDVPKARKWAMNAIAWCATTENTSSRINSTEWQWILSSAISSTTLAHSWPREIISVAVIRWDGKQTLVLVHVSEIIGTCALLQPHLMVPSSRTRILLDRYA